MRLLKNKKYKVFWFDIHTQNDWKSREDVLKWAKTLKPIENTWTYIGSIPGWYLFTSGIAGDGEMFDCTAVPKIMIKKASPIR
jgi:hypothetical protein